MIRKLFFLTLMLAVFSCLKAQTIEELKNERDQKQAQLSALQGEVAGLTKKIDNFPGWKFGSLGTLGLSFSQFNNWISTKSPNTYTSTFGFSGSAFANLDRDKFFWRSSGAVNLAKTKLDTDTEDNNDTKYETSADAFGLNSLYGQRITPKLAISALGEYRTTVLSNFNNPGYLDIGTGGTWTPATNLAVVFHPFNYNFVFSKDETTYKSSFGSKIVADFARKLPMGVAWKSNLSAFLSYKDLTNLSNWTWVNGFSFSVWKGIGVGFEFGLRKNKQEGYNYKLVKDKLSPNNFKIEDLASDDNPLQTYWLLGFTYKL
jgi:hypothetical protein